MQRRRWNLIAIGVVAFLAAWMAWKVLLTSSEIPAIADEAIRIGAKVLWMQLGVENAEARAKAEAAGLQVIENRCMKIEHGRFFGGLGWAGVNTKVISAKRAVM